jgi:citrate synthase
MTAPGGFAKQAQESITIGGVDVRDLIPTASLTEALLLSLDGRLPSPQRRRVVDGLLVAIMEHGITPSSLVTRIVLDGAPEAPTTAIAAGLLAIGSQFLGTIGAAGELLHRIVVRSGTTNLDEAAGAVVAEELASGRRIPGFGHNLHGDADPRVEPLLALAEREGVVGQHVVALRAVPAVIERETGRLLLTNAAGAVGAIFSDLGYDAGLIGGFAVVARAAGLMSHVADEQQRPIAREIWQAANTQHKGTR